MTSRILGVGATLAAAVAVALSPISAQTLAGPAARPAQGHSAQAISGSALPRLQLVLATKAEKVEYRHNVKKGTNAQREKRGLKKLTTSHCLVDFATKWAAHMAKNHELTHQDLGPFLTKCHAYYAEENIARGKGMSAKEVVAAWMDSPDHKANIVSKKVKHIATGAYKVGQTWYVVQDFIG